MRRDSVSGRASRHGETPGRPFSAFLVGLVWCLAYGRTSRAAWTTAVSYHGDAWFVLATLNAYSGAS